jgi:hypothetical protein
MEAVEKYILLPSVPPPVAGSRLRTVLAQLMIHHTLLSHIPFDSVISIGADIPPLQYKVIGVTFNERLRQRSTRSFHFPTREDYSTAVSWTPINMSGI